MSSWLDRMSGPQMLVFLGLLMIVMVIIRRREETASAISLSQLNAVQKGWIFISLLAPGLSAKLLSKLSVEERNRLLQAGESITGSPVKVALSVLNTFFKSSKDQVPGKDVSEICSWIRLRYEDEPEELTGLFRKAFL